MKEPLIISLDKDFFYLKVEDEEDGRKILEAGPLFLLGRVFILQGWSPHIEELRNEIDVIPA